MLNGSLYRATAYTYGNEGESLSVSGGTEPVTYTYDALYSVSTLADGNGNTTHYYYNARGYLNALTYPGYAGSTPTYSSTTGSWSGISGSDSMVYTSYDNDGNITGRVDGRGVATTYTYSDPANLLTNVHYALPGTVPTGLVGTPDVNFTYDSYGRTSTVNNGIVLTTYGPTGTTGYDDDDNPLTVQTGYYSNAGTSILFSRSLTYAYYPNNSRETMTVPTSATTTGNFTYGYDTAGRPAAETNPLGETTDWSYQNNDWLSSQADYNSSSALQCTASYAYNPRGFMTDLKNAGGTGSTLAEFGSTSPTYAMTYDAVGNRTVMAVNFPVKTAYGGTTDYAYDSRNQLTQEASTRDGGYTSNFAYDSAENPTTFRSASVPSANADNEIPVASQYVYDGSGNPTTYASNALTFDPENRMISYGTAETNGYTADGLRARKSGSLMTYFQYDGSTLVNEYSSSGGVNAIVTNGANGLISTNVFAVSYFFAYDPQGTSCDRLSSSGTAPRYSDAFGALAIGSTLNTFSGFCSKWGYFQDPETGLSLLGHRFYDANTGRFINRDPIGYDHGVNVYAYCQNRATYNIDPLGYWGYNCKNCPGCNVFAIIMALIIGIIMAILVAFTDVFITAECPVCAPYAAMITNCLVGAVFGWFTTAWYDMMCDEDFPTWEQIGVLIFGCVGGMIFGPH